jgi:ABC-type transport system, involved in lipoprotein release, permease component
MDTLKALTIRNLKLNKKRTIVTIIGIILSVALICAVAGMFTSLHRTMLNEVLNSAGKWHVNFSGVPNNKIETFKNNDDIKDYFTFSEVGYAYTKDIISEEEFNIYNPYLPIVSYSKNALEYYPIEVIKGRLPENENELVLSENMTLNKKIGDKITIEVGDRFDLEGNRIPSGIDVEVPDSYYDGYSNESLITETLENKRIKEYTIVGIIKGLPYTGPSLFYNTALTYSEKEDTNEYSTVFVLYNNPSKYEDLTKSLGDKYMPQYNENYLDLLGVGFGTAVNKAMITMAAIVIGIIMITSVFVIKNGFSISVVERNKQFGMLSSVGATSKQIRKSVLYEGFIVGIISIPLGVILGVGAVFTLVNIVNFLLNEYLMLNLAFYVSWIPVLASILTGAITIFFAALIPAIKVSKIPVIEAIRGNNDIKIKGKKLKTPKYISLLFGVGGEIAHKNLKRSKKKYRTTIVSLVVSIVIFIALSSFMGILFRVGGFYLNTVEYDLEVSYSYRYEDYETNEDVKKQLIETNKKTIEKYNEIIGFGKADRYSIERGKNFSMNEKLYSENYLDYYDYYDVVAVKAIGDDEYQRLIKKIGGNEEKYAEGAILLDQITAYNYKDKKYHEINITNIKVGSTITLAAEEFNFEKGERELGESIDIKIVARTDEKILAMSQEFSYGIPVLVVSDKYFDSIFDDYYVGNLYIVTDDMDSFIDKIDSLSDNLNNEKEYLYYNNIKESVEVFRATLLVMSIFLYGFIGVITLIGVTNIFNTITTNMALRSKEFAMLKAVGMNDTEFNRMIRLESLLYGMKSLIIGIPIGIGLSLLIYNALGAVMILNYKLPMDAIAISIGFVFLVVFMTMKYSVNKINKQNIIETIRAENI